MLDGRNPCESWTRPHQGHRRHLTLSIIFRVPTLPYNLSRTCSQGTDGTTDGVHLAHLRRLDLRRTRSKALRVAAWTRSRLEHLDLSENIRLGARSLLTGAQPAPPPTFGKRVLVDESSAERATRRERHRETKRRCKRGRGERRASSDRGARRVDADSRPFANASREVFDALSAPASWSDRRQEPRVDLVGSRRRARRGPPHERERDAEPLSRSPSARVRRQRRRRQGRAPVDPLGGVVDDNLSIANKDGTLPPRACAQLSAVAEGHRREDGPPSRGRQFTNRGGASRRRRGRILIGRVRIGSRRRRGAWRRRERPGSPPGEVDPRGKVVGVVRGGRALGGDELQGA